MNVVDHAPDTAVVLGRVLNDRHGARSREVPGKVSGSTFNFMIENQLKVETRSVIAKVGEHLGHRVGRVTVQNA